MRILKVDFIIDDDSKSQTELENLLTGATLELHEEGIFYDFHIRELSTIADKQVTEK